MKDLESLVSETLIYIQNSADVSALEDVRISVLGKKGSVTAYLKELGSLPADQRKSRGAKVNLARHWFRSSSRRADRGCRGDRAAW